MWSRLRIEEGTLLCHANVPKPGLCSNRRPLEESLLLPLLNARVIRSANSQPKAAWHVLSLIREDREATPQRTAEILTSTCQQQPGRRAREYLLIGLNQRGRNMKLDMQEFTDFRELSHDMKFNISKELRVLEKLGPKWPLER